MDIHHNTRCILRTVTLAGAVFVFVVIFFEVLFHNALNRRVDRGINIVAVYSSLRRPLQIIVPVYISILSAVYAAQNIVVILFQSVGSGSVRPRKADDIACERAIRVNSLIAFLKPDSLDILVIFFLARIRHHLLIITDFIVGHSLFEDIILGIRVFLRISSHLIAVNAKIILQCLDRRLHIVLFVIHLFDIQHQIVNLFTRCQLRSLAVQDFSPFIRNRRTGILLLGKHLLFVAVAVIPVN